MSGELNGNYAWQLGQEHLQWGSAVAALLDLKAKLQHGESGRSSLLERKTSARVIGRVGLKCGYHNWSRSLVAL